MREKLHEYLLQRPSGATPLELLGLIFTQPGRDTGLAQRILHNHLAPDPRFIWRDKDGVWVSHVHHLMAQPLGSANFVVVDLETTGLGTSAHGIIEIGAARVESGRITAEFQQLVRPGMHIPPFVSRLTGITSKMVADEPTIEEVWPRFVEFVGADILVAHNASYDIGYLNAVALTLQGAPMANRHICTLKLARRLIPGQRRRGLDALAALFGIPQLDRHRAIGDVRITVEVLFQLIEKLNARGISRVDQLLDLQNQARDGKPFICHLPREKIAQLPRTPGIYRLLGEDHRVLYIGKARNLQQRVSSYLSNAQDHSDKTLDLIRQTHDVRIESLGSELEASLSEAEAIRREKPPYNRLGKHLPRIAFLKLNPNDPLPRLQITSRLTGGRARYIGPWRSREEAQRVMKLLTRVYRLRTCAGRLQPAPDLTPCFQGQIGDCSLPCTGAVTPEAYCQQVQDCLRAFAGDLSELRAALVRQRDEHAEAERFEAAARIQRDVDLVDKIRQRQRTLAWVTERQNFLVLQPSHDRSIVLAYGVAGGRLLARTRLSHTSELLPFLEQLAQQFRDSRHPLRP